MTNLYLPKPLLTFGYGIFLILAAVGNLVAQSPEGTSAGGPTPDNPSVPAVPQAPDNSQTQAPDNSQNSPNPQNTYGPLLPQQGNNPYSPFATSSSNPQSSQLTAPSAYVTGARDLSQIGTSDALTQAFGQPGVSGFAADSGAGYSHAPIERILLGPFDLKAALLLSVVSDDNLNSGEVGQGKASDTSFGLTPAILLQYGNHDGQRGIASLIYAPSFTRYMHQSNQDSDNQNVAFNVEYPFDRLSLDFSQTYAQVTGYNQDLNARTTQSSSITTFGGSYEIDDKISVASHVQEVITSFAGTGGQGPGQGSNQAQGQGDTTSSINTALSYHLSDKMTIGPNINVGVDKPEDEKQQTYEQAFLGLTYLPTEKISLNAQGGLQFSQGVENNPNGTGNQNGSSGDETNPIFSVGVGYTPFDSTVLAINAQQSVHASSAESEGNVVGTGIGFTATQRFFQRLYLNFDFNYTHQDTQSGAVNNATGTGGSEDTLAYRPSLSINPTAWSSVAVYYQYLDNESNQPGEAYHDNQLGMTVSIQF